MIKEQGEVVTFRGKFVRLKTRTMFELLCDIIGFLFCLIPPSLIAIGILRDKSYLSLIGCILMGINILFDMYVIITKRSENTEEYHPTMSRVFTTTTAKVHLILGLITFISTTFYFAKAFN